MLMGLVWLVQMTSLLGPSDSLAVSGVFRLVLGLPEVFHVRSFFLLLEALVWLLLR